MLQLFLPPVHCDTSRWSKAMLLAIVCLFSFTPSEAKKMYYPIEVVTGLADLIVTGQIANVEGNSYTFLVDQTIKGIAYKQIKVNMFEEWTCDTRWKKAEAGQKLLLFLKANNANGYDIINGSTGEVFITENKLARFASYNFTIYTKSEKLDDVITGLKNFISCYVLTDKAYNPSKTTFKQLKKDQEVSALKSANEFSAWLFSNMKNYIIVKSS